MGTIGLISSCHLQGNSQGVCKQLHPWRLGWGGGGESGGWAQSLVSWGGRDLASKEVLPFIFSRFQRALPKSQ